MPSGGFQPWNGIFFQKTVRLILAYSFGNTYRGVGVSSVSENLKPTKGRLRQGGASLKIGSNWIVISSKKNIWTTTIFQVTKILSKFLASESQWVNHSRCSTVECWSCWTKTRVHVYKLDGFHVDIWFWNMIRLNCILRFNRLRQFLGDTGTLMFTRRISQSASCTIHPGPFPFE